MMGYRYQLERVRINIEIFIENVGDYLSDRGITFRKGMLGLFAMAILMTLRSSRQNVKKVKDIGFATSVQYKSATAAGAASSLSGYRPQTGYSALRPAPLAGGAATGNLRGTTGIGDSSTGTFNSLAGGYGTLGRSLSTFSTAELLDSHGDTVRILPGDFRDFGGSADFFGQVDTLQTFEGCGVVEKVLLSPGNGKVLVVDGGSNLNSAVLDENGVKQAQRSGWKGVIVVGAIRGSKTIGALPVGVKALGTSPRKGRATTGNKGVNLSFSGVQVVPGNWIYCDKDGIVLSDRELSSGSASSAGSSISMDTGVSTGFGDPTGLGMYGQNPGVAGAVGNRVNNQLPAYGTTSTRTGGLAAIPLSTGYDTTSSLYASRATPTKTAASGLPSAHGPPSSFNSYSHHRTYSNPGSTKSNTTGYIIVAVSVFWIVIVLRYVGRD